MLVGNPFLLAQDQVLSFVNNLSNSRFFKTMALPELIALNNVSFTWT